MVKSEEHFGLSERPVEKEEEEETWQIVIPKTRLLVSAAVVGAALLGALAASIY
jgi:hypothetical protein